jgi:hypothetical protein
MERVNLLLANADRRTSNLIEAVILDACYNQAIVDCVRTARVDEFVHHASVTPLQLIVVVADGLLAEPSRRASWVSVGEVANAIRAIKEQSSAPILALSTLPEHEVPLLEAGAEGVLNYPLNKDKLRSEVRRVLRLHEPAVAAEPASPSLAVPFLRLFQRLRSA